MKQTYFSPLSWIAVAAAVFSGASEAADLTIPSGVTFEQGVEFANPADQHLQLDIARPAGDGPFPAVLCIHGGGFRAGKRESYDALCLTLAQQGFVAVTITYRLAPAFPFPAAVYDCKAAVRWLRANASKYRISPDKIGALGGSAGAHLAQFLGVTAGVPEFEGDQNPGFSSAVSCVVNWYGPSDFTQSYGKSVDAAEVLPLFFGGNLDQKRKEHVIGSPLNWVTPRSAPTLCIHGTEDKYVAFEQSEWLVSRLKASQVDVELLKMEGAGHGFKGPDLAKAQEASLEFLKARLKN